MENNINFSAWASQSEYTGLLIFRAVAEPRNSGKSGNPANFGRNLIKDMSVQHIWNLFQLLGLFTCRKLANLSWNFVTETCKQRSETTRRTLCCEKLGTSHDVKGFAIGSFLCSALLLKEQMMISVRKTLKTLVWSAQIAWSQVNWFLAKFALKITTKSAVSTDCFLGKFAPKTPAKLSWDRPIFPRICPQKSLEIWLFLPRPVRSPGIQTESELCRCCGSKFSLLW